MRILVIGAGGVGSAVAAIARRRDFFERMVLADVSHDAPGPRRRAATSASGPPRSTPRTPTRSWRWPRPSVPTPSSTRVTRG
jgi:glycine/D-amino acid oxidase-like deaminating enzyme